MKRETFGQLVNRRLLDLNMSQRTLAENIGQKPQYLNQLIKGVKDNPGKEVIKALATQMQVSPLEILVALDYLPADVLGDKSETGLLHLLRELPEAQQKMVEIFTSAAHKEYVVKPARAKIEDSIEPPRRSAKKKHSR